MKCELKIIKKNAIEMTLEQWMPFILGGLVTGFFTKVYVILYGGLNVINCILYTFLIIAVIMLYIFARKECNRIKKMRTMDDMGVSYPARNWIKEVE